MDRSVTGTEDGREQRGSRSESLLLAEKKALEMAVGGAPLADVLDLLAGTGAEQLDARAAIFVVDEAEACLRLGAAAGLPDAYRRVTARFDIGPHSPSCGLAAHTGQRVVVGDVTTDALWVPYLALAKELGIGACWSTPIRSFQGTVLGVFTVYHRLPREPEPRDLETIDLLAHTVAILIERDRTDRERRESEVLLASVLDHLPVGVAVYDTNGRVRRTNDVMRRYTADVLPSADDRAVPRWRATGSDGRPVERHNFAGARALRGETVVPGIDFQYRQDDGTDVWTRVSAAPLRNEAGQITGAVAVVTDIDAEKRAEQDLKVALSEARQNELVAREMSHRIMNSFQLLHGVLSMQTREISDPEARGVVEQAFDRVQAMAVVHRRLFEATRRDLSTLDVAGYLRGLVEGIAAAFIDGTRCALTVEVPDAIQMETGQMDTGRASSLGLITTELILNALKHAFGDGGPGLLSIRFDLVEQDYRLTIADNGPGLPPDLDLTASSGLGMKLVQGLVQQLDGTLVIEDANPGSRFVITFPA